MVAAEAAPPSVDCLPAELAAIVGDVAWRRLDAGRGRSVIYEATMVDGQRVFLKAAAAVGPGDGSALLGDEYDRLRWLAGRLPVPDVLGWSFDEGSGDAFLLTSALPGTIASSGEHLGDIEALIRSMAVGLRAMHELPVADCPFDARLAVRLDQAKARVQAGLVDEAAFDAPYRRYSAQALFALLDPSHAAAHEDLVVVHGDYRLPNIALDRGTVVGYLDLARAGVADRYVDLAIAASDLAHHVSPHALGPFFDAYGIEFPDVAKVDFYVMLDELF